MSTIAVVGITGNQGSSVAATFLNEPGWKVRGISRDITKPSAKEWTSKGVEMVSADLDDVERLKAAFKGASVIFGNTDMWAHVYNPAVIQRAAQQNLTPNELAVELEVQQGKNLIDAAAANIDTLDRFVLSVLSDTKKWSKGKITFNLHFNAKSAIVQYLREAHPRLLEKTSFLQLGVYATNWEAGHNAPKKQADGTYKVTLPMSGDTKFPMVNQRTDTGPMTKALVELPAGKNVMAAGSVLSWKEFWCQIWAEHVGVTCTYEQQDRKVMEEQYGPSGRELADMFQYIDEFGYDGGDPSVEYPWDLGVDVKMMSMEEYVKSQDWSSIL